MAEETTTVQTTGITAETQEKTFTQADVDKLIQSRLDRERKKYPTDEELTAYRTWKEGQQTEQERREQQEKDLKDAKAALGAAQTELEQLRRDKYVMSKGLTGEQAEFIAFKAGKMVDEKTTFEQAVDQLTAEKKTTTFDWMAPAGKGPSKGMTLNERINNELRG